MRYCSLSLVIGLTLILISCPGPGPIPSTSSYVQQDFARDFSPVVSYDQLGEQWAAAGGWAAVNYISTDDTGARALFAMDGEDYPALFVDLSQGMAARAIKLQRKPVYVDVERLTAYSVEDDEEGFSTLFVTSLPEVYWRPLLAPADWDGRGIIAVSGHPGSDSIWVVGRIDIINDAEPGGGSSNDSTDENPDEAGHYEPAEGEISVIRSEMLIASRLDPGADDPVADQVIFMAGGIEDLQLSPLADGNAVISTGSEVYFTGDTEAPIKHAFSSPAYGNIVVRADIKEPICWVYRKPQGTKTGTGKTSSEYQPGGLYAVDADGTELAAVPTGRIPFSTVLGDWQANRGFVAQSSVGVAMVDPATGGFEWLLRNGGDARLHLAQNGEFLWALVLDGIVRIDIDDLVRLAPELTVNRVMPINAMRQLEVVTDSLGWDWAGVRISPLLAHTGQLALFDTADPGSTWSELDWSQQQEHVSRLLVAREPSETDLALIGVTGEEIEEHCRAMLNTFGWPDAAQDPDSFVHDEYELMCSYILQPEPPPGQSGGSFNLWLTHDALTMMLDAPTTGFPESLLPLEEIRQMAAIEVAAFPGMAGREIQVALEPEAGWVVPGRKPVNLMPEPEEGAVPCYRVQAISDGEHPSIHVLHMHAQTGETLEIMTDMQPAIATLIKREGAFGPMTVPVGE